MTRYPKPCPFCGSTAVVEEMDDGSFWVHCTACDAFSGEALSRGGALEKWNRREREESTNE